MNEHRLRRIRTIGLVFPLALITVAACGDTDDEPGGDADGTPSPTSSPTMSPTSPPTSTPTPALASCTNDEIGYTVGYPEDWHTNQADVAASCTYFDPEPVALEEGTEADTAIAFSQDNASFETASSPEAFDRVRSRDSATIDGREAVAVVEEASGEGLLEQGTLSYTWMIDVSDGIVVASTHDGPDRDFQEAMDVLDLMISNLDFSAPAPDEADTPSPDEPEEPQDPEDTDGTNGDSTDGNGADGDAKRTVVARYDSRDQPFVVTAERSADEVCLVASARGDEGEPACWSGQPTGELTMRSLDVPGGTDAIGGLAAPRLARVLTGLDDQGTAGFRPSAVDGADVNAWAVPVAQPDAHHVVGYTSGGQMAAMLDAQGEPTSVLANVNTRPENSEASEDVRLLNGVDSGLHAGYDRVAFRFRDDVPGYDVSYAEGPVTEAGSGREVDVAGDAVITVRMQAASGRERTGGGEQTYTGPERLSGAGTYAITEIVRTGDFEGVLSWAIGVDSELPMRVQVFDDVLVVDVRHPEE